MLTTVTSTELLLALRGQPDEQAWQRFFTRYEPALQSFARRSGLRDEDARDVVQEALMAFVGAFREGRYDPNRGRVRAWLKGIVLNKVREAHRKIAHREVQVVDKTDATAYLNRIPDEHQLTDIFEEEWNRAVLTACLEEARREVAPETFRAFELYAVKGWPVDEVARQLGMSPNAVYISKCRVLSRLRELQTQIAEVW